MNRQRTRYFLVAWLGVAVLALGATSVSAQPEAAGATASHSASADRLKIALPGNSVFQALVYIGAAKHYFQKLGLAVEIQDLLGAGVNNLVVAGQADVSSFTPTVPMLTAKQGKPLSIFYAFGGGGAGGSLMVRSGITSLAQLKSISNCKVTSLGAGASSYAFFFQLKRSLGLSNCTLNPLPTFGAQLGAVASGNVDAIVGSLSSFYGAISAGQVHVLLDASKPAIRKQYYSDPPGILEVTLYGTKANLSAKRPAIIKLIKGMNQARQFLNHHTPAQVAAVLNAFQPFTTISPGDIPKAVSYLRPFFASGNSNGYITQGQWNQSLQGYKDFGIAGFDASDSTYTYKNMIDMSYYDQALGKPKGG
jgi:ABC-type nitrate/sulfonate/bicarbonate transport system substrate-binding protein